MTGKISSQGNASLTPQLSPGTGSSVKENVTVYSVTLAESASHLKLSRGNLLLVALLIGNDYDEV